MADSTRVHDTSHLPVAAPKAKQGAGIAHSFATIQRQLESSWDESVEMPRYSPVMANRAAANLLGTAPSPGIGMGATGGAERATVQRACAECEAGPQADEETSEIQTKLAIGQPGDKYEQEADRVAQQVVNTLHAPQSQTASSISPSVVQPQSIPGQPAIPDITLMRQGTGTAAEASEDVEERIQRSRGQGQPLGESVRAPMEQAFGADFSGVRVHTDGESDELNQAVQAKAFTTGQDIYFRGGAYEPGSRGGQELLAHELTHVLQQNSSNKSHVQQSIEDNHNLTASVQQRSDDDVVTTDLESATGSARGQGQTLSDETITLPPQDIVHPVAAALNASGTRFRLPEFDRVKSAYLDPDLKIPEKVIKTRIAQLLERMEKEGKLKTKDTVPDIIAKIFPAPGKIDEAEFEKAVDVGDRSIIYKNVLDTVTKVKKTDKPKLKIAIKDSISLIQQAEKDSKGLKEVFGAQDKAAQKNYTKARTALLKISKNMDKKITTDYNLDDPQVGLGGWADFSSQSMHLTLETAKVSDPNEAKITLIHEASHLANASVDDDGYYGSDGFEAMTDLEKLNNAAHYEEIPRRILGTSLFLGITFKPGVKKGGGKVTREDKVKRDASEFMRKAWDAAVDTHTLIRWLRKEYLRGSKREFRARNAQIMDISKKMDLTIHAQNAAKAIVTTLDVTLTESIARATSLIGDEVASVPFPSPIGKLTDIQLRDKIIAEAVKNYGKLLQDAKRDKTLLDWLSSNYRKVF